MITGKLYDRLKFLALVALPAFGALYVTIAALWDLPKPQEVAGTVLAVDTFLGAILQISSNEFKKNSVMVGDMLVADTPAGGVVHSLEVDDDKNLETLAEKKEVRFRVVKDRPKVKPRARKVTEDGLALVEALVVLALIIAVLAILFAAGVFR